MRRWIRAATTAGAVTAVLAGIGALPSLAEADSTVTVPANALPDTRTAQVGLVGCSSLYERGTEPLQPKVARPDDIDPDGNVNPPASLGNRAVSYDLAGGNAVGPLYYRDSMLKTSVAGFEAYANTGADGVAYAGYQSPRADGEEIWIGRAALSLTAKRWTTIDATRLTYRWAKYDMSTLKQVAGTTKTATVAAFAAKHGGDGAGFYSVGFGCDGTQFYMDSWRVGSAGAVTTWNLEGLSTTTTSTSAGRTVRPGQSVTLGATLTDNVGAAVPRGTLQLQSKSSNRTTDCQRPVAGGWCVEKVVGAADGSVSTTITPQGTTTYRWVFADRPLATGSTSAPVVVRVAPR